MALLSRLCLLLALSASITARPARKNGFLSTRAAHATCIDDSYTTCGGGLPSNFCCPTGTTCVVSYGSSRRQNTTAICCLPGSDCTYIVAIPCDTQLLNATAYHDSAILTTELDTSLPLCGKLCCPPGFACTQGVCMQKAKHVAFQIDVTTSSASTAQTVPFPTMIAPTRTATVTATSTSTPVTAASTKNTPATATKTALISAATSAADHASTSPPAAKTLKTTAIVGPVIAFVVAALLVMLSWHYRRHLLTGWRRFVSFFSSCFPSGLSCFSRFSSSRSIRSSGSSVKYDTDEAYPLQHPAPTWAIPLSSDWWWEPVRRQWPWIKPPWQSPRQSRASLAGSWPKARSAPATFAAPMALPISQYNIHHDPETGIVTSPPLRSAARFAEKQQRKVARKAEKAEKAENPKKPKKNICNRLSSGFYRVKALPPIPHSPPLLVSANFASAPSRPETREAGDRYIFQAHKPSVLVLHDVEGTPVLAGSPTPPQSTPSLPSPSSKEAERVHNTPLLPMPVQPHTQQRPSPSPWPRPLRLARHVSASGYSAVSQAVEHSRSVSDSLPRRHHLGVPQYDPDYQAQPQPRQRISPLPSVWRQPLPGALQSLPSQAPFSASASAPLVPPPMSAIPGAARNRLGRAPHRSASPVELPATPVAARMLDVNAAHNGMPINAFGILDGGSDAYGPAPRRTSRQRPWDRHHHVHGVPSAYAHRAPVCPYPQDRDSIGALPTPPLQRRSLTGPSVPQNRSLPPILTDAPPVLPPIPVFSAIQARCRSTSSPLSMVTHQQQQMSSTQPPAPADIETPMSSQSTQSMMSMMSPLSPTTPRIEEAQVRRLPRMAQARMMEQHQ